MCSLSSKVVFGVVIICLFGSAALGQPWLGSGTAEDPYQIWTAADMQAIGADANYWEAQFVLCADIDLADYNGVGGNPSFNVIGSGPSFTGVFDGNGHTVSNLTLEPTAVGYDYYIGLFGSVSHLEAEVRDLGLVFANINGEGKDYVGALVGLLKDGNVRNCYVQNGVVCEGVRSVGGLVGRNWEGEIWNSYAYEVDVNSTSEDTGGLVGMNDYGIISNCSVVEGIVQGQCVGGLVGRNYGSVSNCRADGLVEGSDTVGGLIGDNDGHVLKSYSVARVLPASNYTFIIIGGLVGRNQYGGVVTDSFWDVNSSGQSDMCGEVSSGSGCDEANGKITVEMQTASTFTDAGWDFNTPIWIIDDGNDYPRLWFEEVFSTGRYGGGRGLPKDPYLIYTGEDMQTIGANPIDWNKHFKLMADIDLGDYTGTQFNLIGHFEWIDYWATWYRNSFIGVFDGSGRTISGFTYVVENENLIGLFRLTKSAVIKNLGLIDPNVAVGGSVGALVGYADLNTRVTGCYVEGGVVSGSYFVGGLVANNGGNIINCYSMGNVNGIGYGVGGLVGLNQGMISDSYSSSAVGGNRNVGGLAGWNNTEISNCYARGPVFGAKDVGGLVGFNEYGQISFCYTVSSVSADSNLGGLVGYDDGGFYTKCFWDSEVNPDVNGIGNGSDPNVIGETTPNMQTESTFTDASWDFVWESVNGTGDIWTICEGVDYPKLAWQFVIGDFDGDDDVDFADFAIFAAYWLEADSSFWCGGTDLTSDNQVGLDDLREFTENWLAGL